MISADKLTFSYPDAKRPALDAVSFEVSEGTCLGLCGVNGSGKSTLLSLMAGLHIPTSGQLHVAGIAAAEHSDKLRRLTSLVLQDADLQIIGSTVAEDMLLAFPANLESAEDTARHMAKRFGLEEHWDSPVQTLSYGQKRKLCLAVALLVSPGLLLLDEPFSGLDYPSILEMREILQHNKDRRLTQVISVHDLEPVADMLDYIVVLHNGVQVLHGKPEDVLDDIQQYGVRQPCFWQQSKSITDWR